MRIYSIESKQIYDIPVKSGGENAMPCPECGPKRKPENRKKKSFSWNEAKKTGFCNNCQARFIEYKPFTQTKEYKVPERKNDTKLTDKALAYIEGRMIGKETISSLGVYSDMEFMPQINKEVEVICFPYIREGKLINIKFRGPQKSFKMVKDAELIFFNLDSLIDLNECIIVEGEFDCMAFVHSGRKNCISVPNGAGAKNLEYIDSCVDLFDRMTTVYLAVDNDQAGIGLREELIRRIGSEKCKIVSFKDCKDANEYMLEYGPSELYNLIDQARPLPINGEIIIDDQYDSFYDLFLNGLQPGAKIEFSDIDNLITWERGRMAVVTGIPGHGKSELIDFIVTRLNVLHGWKVGYFSPENYPVKNHFAKVTEKLIGKTFSLKYMNQHEFDMSFSYVRDNFFWIYPEDDMSFDNIISGARQLIKRRGINVFVLDPWNKIEHCRERGESETEYISRVLDKISQFCKTNNCLFIICAHPRKMEKEKNEMKYKIPSMYDINGSANFYNKCDYGISVYRDYENKLIEVHVQKVKFKHLGDGGACKINYNYTNGRFESMLRSIDDWDYKAWIGDVAQLEIKPEKNFDQYAIEPRKEEPNF
jgi:twinkle protein